MSLSLGEIMTREVRTLQHDQVLLDAMQLLRSEGVRHLPVLEGDALRGIITDRDVKRATPSALAPAQREVWETIVQETPLERVMTAEPITATPATTLDEALRTFLKEGIGCLPVLEEGRLVGIVTASDLFRGMLRLLEG